MTRSSSWTTRRRAFDELFALDEDGDPVAEVEDEAHVVLDDEDGDALVADGEDQFLGGAGLLGVHAGRGLVEQQQAGVAGQCPGDLQLALFAVGEVAGEVVRALPARPTNSRSSMALAREAASSRR